MEPARFTIRQTQQLITGQALARFAKLPQQLDAKFPVRGTALPTSNVVKSYVGLLCQAKSDFEAIEAYRGQAFFPQTLGLGGVSSAARLSAAPVLVPMDAGFDAGKLFATIDQASRARQREGGAPIEALVKYNPRGADAEAVIGLYKAHGTHEQFHAEIKTDLDLERLPSGKFTTNDLVLSLAALTYNVLRLIGQNALTGDDAPPRPPAKRRRLRTVIQELMGVAATIAHHARSRFLVFGAHWPALACFRRLHAQWRLAPP